MIDKKYNCTRRDLMKVIGSAGLATTAGQCAWARGNGFFSPAGLLNEGAANLAVSSLEDLSFNISWNSIAEKVVEEALGAIPYVGSILSGIVSLFWPTSGEGIWDQIKAQVQQIVDKSIADNDYKLIKADLDGLSGVLANYLHALADKNAPPSTLSAYWISTNTDFTQFKPSFQLPGYEILLLPMFAQFATMHLSLLRDGALFGQSRFGWDAGLVSQTKADLTKAINDYTTYANDTYNQHIAALTAQAGTNYHLCQPFRTVNAYTRQVTRPVLDHIALWPYFDVTKYPNPVTVELNSELYSDPLGTCDDSGPIRLPTPPTKPVSQIKVWAWEAIDAFQFTYPENGGPGGVTDTGRMGGADGGNSTSPPYGGTFDASSNPIVNIKGYAGDIPMVVDFTFKDGSESGNMGGASDQYPRPVNYQYGFEGHVLSSVHVNGISVFYKSPDCIVFGFQLERSTTVDLDAARRLYIGSPGDVALSEFASSFVTRKISTHELKRRFVEEEEWDRLRQEYRDSLKSRTT